MPSQIYAVIFDQGTVKVGQSVHDAWGRIKEHKFWGQRFGVSVVKTFVWNVELKKLDRTESSLCGYCSVATTKRLPGSEWFMFEDITHAEKVILSAMENIQNGVFGEHGKTTNYDADQPIIAGGWSAALDLIRDGMSVQEASYKTGIKASLIYPTTAYKSLKEELRQKRIAECAAAQRN